jgi:hypothetical protein
MKTRSFILLGIILLLSIRNFTLAQKTGIYLTHSDFDSAKIAFVKKENLKYKLRVDNLFNESSVKVVIGDSTYKFLKDSIFGYRDDDNVNHRFYNRKTYRILNPKECILLYSITTIVNPKGNQTAINYYFSVTASSAIYPLTKLNLKREFPDDSNFHELIDMYFNTDLDLLAFDSFYNLYKINRIYQIKQSHK